VRFFQYYRVTDKIGGSQQSRNEVPWLPYTASFQSSQD
jgi:hypothetical protein